MPKYPKDIQTIRDIYSCDSIQKTLTVLYQRWLDEREYEDFREYELRMKNRFNDYIKNANIKNAKFIKATKRPFGFTFKINQSPQAHITLNSKYYRLKFSKEQ